MECGCSGARRSWRWSRSCRSRSASARPRRCSRSSTTLIVRKLPVRAPDELILFRWASGPVQSFDDLNGYGTYTDEGYSSTSFSNFALESLREGLTGKADVVRIREPLQREHRHRRASRTSRRPGGIGELLQRPRRGRCRGPPHRRERRSPSCQPGRGARLRLLAAPVRRWRRDRPSARPQWHAGDHRRRRRPRLPRHDAGGRGAGRHRPDVRLPVGQLPRGRGQSELLVGADDGAPAAGCPARTACSPTPMSS